MHNFKVNNMKRYIGSYGLIFGLFNFLIYMANKDYISLNYKHLVNKFL